MSGGGEDGDDAHQGHAARDVVDDPGHRSPQGQRSADGLAIVVDRHQAQGPGAERRAGQPPLQHEHADQVGQHDQLQGVAPGTVHVAVPEGGATHAPPGAHVGAPAHPGGHRRLLGEEQEQQRCTAPGPGRRRWRRHQPTAPHRGGIGAGRVGRGGGGRRPGTTDAIVPPAPASGRAWPRESTSRPGPRPAGEPARGPPTPPLTCGPWPTPTRSSWRRSSTCRSAAASCSPRPRSTAASARPMTTGPSACCSCATSRTRGGARWCSCETTWSASTPPSCRRPPSGRRRATCRTSPIR